MIQLARQVGREEETVSVGSVAVVSESMVHGSVENPRDEVIIH